MPRDRSQGTAAQTPTPTPTPTFAIAPALAIAGIIDMGSSEGRKMYKDGTASISDPLFNLLSTGLKLFLSGLRRRARLYGWPATNGILQIPEDSNNQASPTHNLITEYGEVTGEMIRRHDATYMGRNDRRYQDNCILFECLMNSIDETAKKRIALKEHEYIVGDETSGSLLLKTIIKASRLDTTASENMIRERLSNLGEYMKTVEHNNISAFNDYVRGQVDALAARGAVSTDLLVNLFKGYLTASNHRFTKYIEDKQSTFEDGRHYTEDELMDLAETRYELLKDKVLWNKPSEDQKQLLLMQAQLENLKQSNPRTGKRKRGNNNDGPPRDNNRQDNDRGRYKGRKWIAPPEWKENNTRPTDINTRNWWLGRWWYFCCKESGGQCLGKWVCHEPSKCLGRTYRRQDDDQPPTTSTVKPEQNEPSRTERTNSTRKAKIVSAISAELNDDSSSDDATSQA